MAWRAGGESINSLILQGGELQRARARQLVRTNPYASNAAASFTAHAVGCGIKPSSLVEDGALKDRDPAPVARLDRRGRCRWPDRLLRPPGHGGARHVRGRRVLPPVPPAPPGRWAHGAAAAADALLRAPAARQVRDAAERQRDHLRHRARPDRAAGRLPLPPHPSRRRPPARCGRAGPGAGGSGLPRVPPDRRGPDPGRAVGRAGDGPALAARPVRRRRARPEEGRGDVRGLRHPARARRRHGRGQRPEGCRTARR